MKIHPVLILPFFLILFISCNNDEVQLSLACQNNAIWSESIYFRGHNPSTLKKLTPDDLYNYASTLKKYRIKYAYLFAGPYGDDGHLPAYAFSDTAISSVSKLKEYYPELIILPWVGGLQNKTVHLEDSVWVKNALEDTQKLIKTLKVSGVHVDMEFLLKQDVNFFGEKNAKKSSGVEAYANNLNIFHKKLRQFLPKAFISSVVVATSPDTRPWKRKTSMDELKILVNYVDQLSFLYFDTHINDQQIFEKNCYSLIKDIKILTEVRDIQYLIAIGTFVNKPELWEYRNMEIENIPNTLSVIKKSISTLNIQRTIVDGIGIYCDWQTDQDEWNQFNDYWVKVD